MLFPRAILRRSLACTLRRAVDVADQFLHIRSLLSEKGAGTPCLDGDRAIEWSWVVAHLPRSPCRVLDVGCVQSALTGIAARLGHQVTAVDLRDIEYEMDNVVFVQGNITDVTLPAAGFEVIINCSTVEHVGLAGRYNGRPDADGDLTAMKILAASLTSGGRMLLTIPVGRDAVFLPMHRVYGSARLPALLRGYRIVAEEYWTKEADNIWRRTQRDQALQVKASERFYALGCFVLQREDNSGQSCP